MTIISSERDWVIEALAIEIEELKAANTRLQVVVAETDEDFSEVIEKLEKFEKLIETIHSVAAAVRTSQPDAGYSIIVKMIHDHQPDRDWPSWPRYPF